MTIEGTFGHRQQLARTSSSFGVHLRNQGRLAEAHTMLEKALESRERLAGDFPLATLHKLDLGNTYVCMGFLMRDEGNPAKALELFQKAASTLEAVYPQVRGHFEAERDLCEAYLGRAVVLRNEGEPAKSLEWFAKSAGILETFPQSLSCVSWRTPKSSGTRCSDDCFGTGWRGIMRC
jgi:tetratricopeptide (TPR) repeat protein